MTPPAVPWIVPPKIRELEARLRDAGLVRQASKGSHRKWVHGSGRFVIMSGGAGDDAKKYQEQQVHEAIITVTRRPAPK
jgi:predicted RNA binding protein YcfA (HicA-like mRNA interferase family)